MSASAAMLIADAMRAKNAECAMLPLALSAGHIVASAPTVNRPLNWTGARRRIGYAREEELGGPLEKGRSRSVATEGET